MSSKNNNPFPFIVKNESKAIVTISKPTQSVIREIDGKLIEEMDGCWVIHVKEAE